MGYSMFTATGRAVDPLALQPGDVSIEDIAIALSQTCRYGGHCQKYYSVAEHSVHLARYRSMPEVLRPVALMHDAGEAYCGDLIRPIKQQFPEFEEQIERGIVDVIFERFGLDTNLLPEIKQYDLGISIDEMTTFMARGADPHLVKVAKPLGIHIPCWEPWRAKVQFLQEFTKLFPSERII